MRIRIDWEGAEFRRRLVEAHSLTGPVVETAESLADQLVRPLFPGGKEIFLNRQQQLGHHMPVDAAQPLEAKHATGASGECPVIEYLFVEFPQWCSSWLQ